MYIFYDTEATGLDTDFTQLLQVALVFTDDDFNILSAKKIECRKAPWIVPSPGAMLITGFTPDDLKNNKFSHYEMMSDIESWIKAQHWPIVFAGYNTLGFDESALAGNLGQNLLQTDLTTAQSKHGTEFNSRLDVFSVVKAVVAYMPGVLTLDIKNDFGSPSLSLLNVAKQNGVSLQDNEAHDAMNDIKATIGVAKLIKKAAPQIWDQMAKMTTVQGVDAFLSATPLFVYTNASYGRKDSLVATSVAATGNTQVIFDTACDPSPYLRMSEQELAAVISRGFDRKNRDEAPSSWSTRTGNLF